MFFEDGGKRWLLRLLVVGLVVVEFVRMKGHKIDSYAVQPLYIVTIDTPIPLVLQVSSVVILVGVFHHRDEGDHSLLIEL